MIWRVAGTAVLALAALVACGGDDGSFGRAPMVVDVPAELEGVLDVSVEEGDVGDDGISDLNFGSLELSDGYVLVMIDADVVRAAGLDRDQLLSGGRFRIRIEEDGERFDPRAPTYPVASIEPIG